MGGWKKIIYQLLCNSFIGKIILFLFKDRIPDIRWKGYSYTFKKSNIPVSIIASVFWGFYESSEIRFTEKYFKGDLDVLEMGGSCGIVTSHLVSKLEYGKRLIAVEANWNLCEVWKGNVQRHNKNQAETFLLNNAIQYGSDTVSFIISKNTTESSGVEAGDNRKNTYQIPAITLGKIIEDYAVKNYFLVCDIEGAEVQIFLNETNSLKTCKAILIELHHTVHKDKIYSIENLRKLIENRGFSVKENYGPVYYFERLI